MRYIFGFSVKPMLSNFITHIHCSRHFLLIFFNVAFKISCQVLFRFTYGCVCALFHYFFSVVHPCTFSSIWNFLSLYKVKSQSMQMAKQVQSVNLIPRKINLIHQKGPREDMILNQQILIMMVTISSSKERTHLQCQELSGLLVGLTRII